MQYSTVLGIESGRLVGETEQLVAAAHIRVRPPLHALSLGVAPVQHLVRLTVLEQPPQWAPVGSADGREPTAQRKIALDFGYGLLHPGAVDYIVAEIEHFIQGTVPALALALQPPPAEAETGGTVLATTTSRPQAAASDSQTARTHEDAAVQRHDDDNDDARAVRADVVDGL